MGPFLLRRLLAAIPALVGVTFVTFALLDAVPGDASAFAALEGDDGVAAEVDAEAVAAAFRERHLTDAPLWRRYLHYVGPFNLAGDGHRWFGGDGSDPWGGVLALDLGTELLRPQVSVAGELARRLAVTLPMTLIAIVLAYLLAIPLGVRAAVHAGTRFDRGVTAVLFALYAVPVFWLGLLLQQGLGGTGLGLLPSFDVVSPDVRGVGGMTELVDRLLHLVLPVVCYTLGALAYLARQARSGMLEALAADWITAARARGVPEGRIVWGHALRGSALPLVTLLAGVLPALVGGSVVVEVVFDLPGMGRYVFESLLRREFPSVLGAVLLGATMTVAGLVLSDVLTAWIDPRVRVGRRFAGE